MFIEGYEITKEEPDIDYESLGIKMSDDEPKVFNIRLKKIIVNTYHVGAVAPSSINVPHISKNDVYELLIQGVDVTFLPIGEDPYKEYFTEELPNT